MRSPLKDRNNQQQQKEMTKYYRTRFQYQDAGWLQSNQTLFEKEGIEFKIGKSYKGATETLIPVSYATLDRLSLLEHGAMFNRLEQLLIHISRERLGHGIGFRDIQGDNCCLWRFGDAIASGKFPYKSLENIEVKKRELDDWIEQNWTQPGVETDE